MAAIPQCDPRASYFAQREAIDAALARAMAGGRYILGPEVAAFESEFAAFCGARHALGVANGTDALTMALRIAGVGPGDRVLTVSHTAVATAVAIRAIGASPVFVDVDEADGVMDPRCLEQILAADRPPAGTGPLRAVVPVHLYGRCVDMPAICALARAHGLAVVEDCAQAHGAVLDGKPVGSWGRCASFSFYPTKNLGAFGDGGAVTTDDADLLEAARLLREYGWKTRYVSAVEGGNSRLDELQAAMLRVKLERLAEGNAARAALAAIYQAGIDNPHVRMSAPAPAGAHVYHQFVLRTPAREELREHLSRQGIGTLVHYPVPVHLQPAYTAAEFSPRPLPCSERWGREVLSLPMFPELSADDARRVVAAVNDWVPSGA